MIEFLFGIAFIIITLGVIIGTLAILFADPNSDLFKPLTEDQLNQMRARQDVEKATQIGMERALEVHRRETRWDNTNNYKF